MSIVSLGDWVGVYNVCHFSVPPSILRISGDFAVSQGSDLSLTCLVSTQTWPQPVILWHFNNQLIVPSADSRISFPTRNSLLVKYVQPEDAGNYECIAENSAGFDSMSTVVLIRRKYIQLVFKAT